MNCEHCGADISGGDRDDIFVKCNICDHWTPDGRTFESVKSLYSGEDYVMNSQKAVNGFDKLCEQWTTNIGILKQFRVRGLALEVGCREGAGVAALTAAGYETFGFDISEKSKECSVANGIPAHRIFVADDFCDLTLPIKFDIITVREVIEHVPNPVKFLGSCASKLAVNGLLQVQTPRYDRVERFWSEKTHLRIYSKKSLMDDISGMPPYNLSLVHELLWQGGMCLTFKKIA